MRTHLGDILDTELLKEMVSARFVKKTAHQTLPLYVYNYTAKAQYSETWNAATTQCRGLIVDSDNTVVARPFPKFFNHDPNVRLSGAVEITEKLDGSLGILYPASDNEYAIATRGSFDSEQALHATALWQSHFSDFKPDKSWTYLFEILYPENRIVVDYGDLDDLVLLGAIEIATGRDIPLTEVASTWPGSVVRTTQHTSLEDLLQQRAAPNSEGFVVRYAESGTRVKVKHDEYVRIHKIVTEVSERRVWEALSSGQSVESWIEAVPDETFDFVRSCSVSLLEKFAGTKKRVDENFAKVMSGLPQGWVRRDFADAVLALATVEPLAKCLFGLLDGRSIDDAVWESLRPAEHTPLFGGHAELG
jgi:RNA ligase